MFDSAMFVPEREALERTLRGATAADAVLVAHQYLRAGSPRAAVALCEAARALGLSDPALQLSEATGRFAVGDRPGALAIVDAVLSSAPEHRYARYLRAHMLAVLGRRDEAKASLVALSAECPDFPGAQSALSALLMPGPQYRDVLALVHRLLSPATYLEIGVETGATLALATTAQIAVGVDPAPRLSVALPASARLYAVESDSFFATETRASAFDGRAVDLAFIDGMHWFEYALRDFVNTEAWSHPESVVLLHDCLPATRVAARRERESGFWVGDVWKVLEILVEYRQDLRIFLVPTPPSGIVVVRGLDPSSRALRENMAEIVARYRDLLYPHEPGNLPARYGVVVDNTAAGIQKAISG